MILTTPPTTPIEHLTEKFREYLHLPDPSPLYALMGAAAANMIEGDPVWLMLIGPPSCGKSELVNTLLAIPNTVGTSSISGEAAFLSGSPEREKAKDATGGLLCQISGNNGSHNGALILNDFTTILSRPERTAAIMSCLREIYSGYFARHLGGEGGRELSWTGRLAVYAGCTSEIDQHHSISAKMGERWINFRIEPRTNYHIDLMMILSNWRPDKWRGDLAEYVRDFFALLGLSYAHPQPRREFTASERDNVYLLANMGAHCRSGVPRDGYSHEVNGVSETEVPVRLSAVFTQLLAGLEKIGVPAHIRWSILYKISMDSMPKIRRMIIETIQKQPMTVEQLTESLNNGCGLSFMKRLIQDLETHNVVRRTNGKVTLTEWLAASYSKLFILLKPPPMLTLRCPHCLQNFQVPAGETGNGRYTPTIPAHPPCGEIDVRL